MKKIIILGTILLSTPLWAQVYVSNARTVSDLNANAINIAPGVSIVPPAWSQGLRNQNDGNYNNRVNSMNRNNSTINAPGGVPLLDQNTGSVTIAGPTNVKNQQTQEPAVENIQTPNKTIATPSITNNVMVQSKPISKPAVVSVNISQWNRTTQNEIESKAKKELEDNYKLFLVNN